MYLQKRGKLRTQQCIKVVVDGFTYARAANRTRYRENGGGRKRGEGMGKWGDIVGVVVVGGVGGSTGCPECTEVSRGRCKRGKEWQRMFVFR